jgi:hypothetical protein
MNAAELNQAWPAEGEQIPKHRQTNIALFIRCMANALQLSAQGFETGEGSWTNQVRTSMENLWLPLFDAFLVSRGAALRPSKGMDSKIPGPSSHTLVQVSLSPTERSTVEVHMS